MPRDRFKRLVATHSSASPELPLVHSTDWYSLNNAIDDQQLDAPECNVFSGENLVYLFYGRPSYRANADEEATSLDHYLPVCLIFRPGSVSTIKRIYPFDSGGFHNQLYSDALHRRMRLDDFLLDPDPTTPGRLISLFFGTTHAYMHARANMIVDLDPSEVEARSYHALISHKLSNLKDNRVSGIEIQHEGPLNIPGNVQAVILPAVFLDSSIFKAKLEVMNIDPLPYNLIDRMRPSEYVHGIFEVCIQYYRSSGYIA